MRRAKATEPPPTDYEDILDIKLQRHVRIEHTTDGRPQRWLLDRCFKQLAAVAYTKEQFPWSCADKPRAPRAETADPARIGKWLVFLPCPEAATAPGGLTPMKSSTGERFSEPLTVGDIWAAIAAAVYRGELYDAKISLTNRSTAESQHIICVYTPDLCDVSDVLGTARKLDAMGVIRSTWMPYKPDAFTLTGTYMETGAASLYGYHFRKPFLRLRDGLQHLDTALQERVRAAFQTLKQ